MNLTFSSFLKFQIQRSYTAPKSLFNTSPFLHYVGIRKLIAPSVLGLDKFLLKRSQIQNQFKKSRDQYINVMEGLYLLKENSYVNSEDLKNMIYICEKEEYELKILQHMIRSFIPGNQKFESKFIGMEYLRLLHTFKLPNEMRKVLNEKELSSLFSKLMSYAIAMSLFYDYKLYKDAIDVYHKMMTEILLQKPPKLQTILALASCYHLNSSWSFQKATSIIDNQEKKFLRLDPRSLSFAAALALRQNHAFEALEITSKTPWNFYLLRNLKILALVSVGREEDALPVLRGYSGGYSKHPSKKDKDNVVLLSTISSVEKALSRNQKTEDLIEFNMIKKDLERKALIENVSLKAALHEPIEEKIFHTDISEKSMISGSFERGKKRAKAQKEFSRVGFPYVKQ